MKQHIIPCGTPQSSDCVLYDGDSLKTQEVDLVCLPTVTTVIEKLDDAINIINKSIDITKLNTYLTIDVKKAKVSDLLQAILSSLNSVKEDVKKLKAQDSADILSTPIQIDLSCLGTNCDNSTSTILTVLTTLAATVCELKEQSNNSNDLYLP